MGSMVIHLISIRVLLSTLKHQKHKTTLNSAMKLLRKIIYKVSEKKLKLLILKDPDRIAAIAEEVKGCKGLIIRNKNLNLSAGI